MMQLFLFYKTLLKLICSYLLCFLFFTVLCCRLRHFNPIAPLSSLIINGYQRCFKKTMRNTGMGKGGGGGGLRGETVIFKRITTKEKQFSVAVC